MQTTFLADLFKSLHGAQRKTLTAVVVAICRAGEARSLGIAMQLAFAHSILLESALNRFYRLLRNPRID